MLALDGVDLSIAHREFVCLLGPSGCGKTTLLKAIAGLVTLDSGEIFINGLPVTGPGSDRAMVFQDFALLPWADVLSNVAFGLELRGQPRAAREAAARELISRVGLAGFERHYPRQLSGGMQQRVGLARALAVNPEILLMDEPFGALDAQTRRLLQEDLLALLQATPHTVVFVTHSVEEAVLLADRVVMLTPRPGRVRDIVTVDLPRPRPPDVNLLPRFSELTARLWRELKEAQS
ncbi:MAG: Taurine import ATP-binding protein TauB [Chloroflexi bacterium ADurb.Bin180]|nr:MAG: Taurine import ATP-binding protein TauB [Chloroflexi bacterium ADurb.Bin180]